MKKVLILIFFVSIFISLNGQILLTHSLVDSISSKLYPFFNTTNTINDRLVINFSMIDSQKNSFYVSATSIEYRQDVHENMKIYISGERLFFVILRNVKADRALESKLIDYNDVRFDKTLDSLNFGQKTCSGCVIMRSPLEVFRVRRRLFSRNTYVITSKKYIPYLSAPDDFIPLKKFAFYTESNEIEPWYYDRKPFKELNAKYYEDMKPSEKIILRMPKK
jgi:hypothetical protein